MIAVVDYGVGNLFSLVCSLKYIGLDAVVTSDADVLRRADGIILPGVGAFGDAREKLRATGLEPVLCEEARKCKPFLGICLGMQMLFDKSFEYGEHEGLGFIKGNVVPFDLPAGMKVPHMGWNSLDIVKDCPLFKYIKNGDYVYYVHSYYATDCDDDVAATSEYGVSVTGVVARGNVFGTQFHPEKSGDTGLNILRAFGELCDEYSIGGTGKGANGMSTGLDERKACKDSVCGTCAAEGR